MLFPHWKPMYATENIVKLKHLGNISKSDVHCKRKSYLSLVFPFILNVSDYIAQRSHIVQRLNLKHTVVFFTPK